jgi:hypothetical protein
MSNAGWTTIELIRGHHQTRPLAKLSVIALRAYRRELETDIQETETITERHRDQVDLCAVAMQMRQDLETERQRVLDEIESRNRTVRRGAPPSMGGIPRRKSKSVPMPRLFRPADKPAPVRAPTPPPVSPPTPTPDPLMRKLTWSVLSGPLLSFPVMRNYLRLNYTPSTGLVMELERLEYLYTFTPSHIYMGKDEFHGYFVLYFQQHLTAVFECPVVGNALYLVRGPWQIWARKSKAELLHAGSKDVRRIIHVGEWRSRLRIALEQQP